MEKHSLHFSIQPKVYVMNVSLLKYMKRFKWPLNDYQAHAPFSNFCSLSELMRHLFCETSLKLSCILSLSHERSNFIYETHLVKGDPVPPAFFPAESLLPSLWHSFALSLSGGGEKEADKEMECKDRAKLVKHSRDTCEEVKLKKRGKCEKVRKDEGREVKR